jgi:hypothetical protein
MTNIKRRHNTDNGTPSALLTLKCLLDVDLESIHGFTQNADLVLVVNLFHMV